MTQQAFNQIWQAMSQGDTMAEMVVGVMALEGDVIKQDLTLAMDCIRRQASYNLQWAVEISQYLQANAHNPRIDYHVTHCLPMSPGALQQIADYGNQTRNLFALTLVGVLMYRGEIVPKAEENAIAFLKVAAESGCLWAKEYLSTITENQAAPTPNFSSVFTSHPNQQTTPSAPSAASSRSSHDYMQELNDMIGLGRVKQEVASLRNFVIVQKQREQNGLKGIKVSYHCVFSGSPGTGKTTVARIVAGIYKDLGILKKGHLVEVQRSDLVAEYEGQTAPKTNKKIDEAMDGVLFIDEAYTLNGGPHDQFGFEAINTLLKRMEDDRDRLVVILAGYSDEIQQFINTNPGLESRFNRYIHFEDYTAEELVRIFAYNLQKAQYVITQEAYRYVQQMIAYKVQHRDGKFGNARYVRNLFEKIIQKQSDRVAHIARPTKEQLCTIMAEDINVNT